MFAFASFAARMPGPYVFIYEAVLSVSLIIPITTALLNPASLTSI